jgi:class 3 adenylate cyclase
MMVETAPIKYIFLDVVGFTKDRSVEAQSDIINSLNIIVRECITSNEITPDKLIVIPSGDGLCIALIDIAHPFDIYMILALNILAALDDYNKEIKPENRKFLVRIGINENIDNLIVDFNGNKNTAGAGINMANRIMEKADGGQILVSETTYDILKTREKYIGHYRGYQTKSKHGQVFNVYQYIGEGHKGLNTKVPSAFVQVKPAEQPLNKILAYYIAHSITNQEFLLSKHNYGSFSYTTIILLYFLALDSEEESNATKYELTDKHAWGAEENKPFNEQFEHYDKIDFWILCRYAECIEQRVLIPYHYCFEKGGTGTARYVFINEKGKTKLKQEWPHIWNEFFGQEET